MYELFNENSTGLEVYSELNREDGDMVGYEGGWILLSAMNIHLIKQIFYS